MQYRLNYKNFAFCKKFAVIFVILVESITYKDDEGKRLHSIV